MPVNAPSGTGHARGERANRTTASIRAEHWRAEVSAFLPNSISPAPSLPLIAAIDSGHNRHTRVPRTSPRPWKLGSRAGRPKSIATEALDSIRCEVRSGVARELGDQIRPRLVSSSSFDLAMSTSLTMEFFMDDSSSSSSDSDLEEVVNDNDTKMMVMILVAKQIQDKIGFVCRRRGSKFGRACIPWNRALGHTMLMQDYFVEVPTYPPHLFRKSSGCVVVCLWT